MKTPILVALALGALALGVLALIALLCFRKDEVAPLSSAALSPPNEVETPAAQLAPAPATEPVAPARESADEIAAKSDLPLLRDLAAGASGKSAEDPTFARKYDGVPASERRKAKEALERSLRAGNSAGELGAEEAAAVSREIAWLEAHPGA